MVLPIIMVVIIESNAGNILDILNHNLWVIKFNENKKSSSLLSQHIHTFMTPKTKSKHLTKSNKLNEIPASQPIKRKQKKETKTKRK